MDRSDLREDQLRAMQFMKDRPYCAVWFGMRQGKCIATLTALQDLYDEIDIARILVVAPKKVCVNAWPVDAEEWRHISLKCEVIQGTEKQRIEKLKSPARIHIVSRDNISWLVSHIGKDNWPYDTVVLDESRSFKNHKPKTPIGELTRFGAIRMIRPKVSRLIELTGTPAPRSYIDLWAQIFLLDGGRRLGKNITEFRKRYCEQGRSRHQWHIRDGVTEEINHLIGDIVFSAEGIKIPEPVPDDIVVPLSTTARGYYNEMLKESIIDMPDGTQIVALEPGARVAKLNQISAGAVYDKAENTHWIDKQKFKELDDLLKLIDDSCLLIYNFQFEREELLRRYSDAVPLDDNPETIKRWNRGKIKYMVMHPASGGHGLTLHRGGDTIIWMSLTDDLEMYQQVNMRLSEAGQLKPSTLYRLLSDSYTDRVIRRDGLTAKDKIQTELIKFVKKNSSRKIARNANDNAVEGDLTPVP